MEIEKQVTSLEPSRRLRDLGVPQGDWESTSPLFYWSYYDGGARRDKPELVPADDCNFGFMEDLAAAFTVAELGEIIFGSVIDGNKPDLGFRTFRDYKGKNVFGWDRHIDFSADTEADARAKCLIYLLENDLIKANDL